MTDMASLDSMEASSSEVAVDGPPNQVAVVCPDWNVSVVVKSAAQNWPEPLVEVSFTRTAGDGVAFTPPVARTKMESKTSATLTAKGRGKHTYTVGAKLVEGAGWKFDTKEAVVEDDARVAVELTATPDAKVVFVVQEGEKALDKATLTLDHAARPLTYEVDGKKTPVGLSSAGPTKVTKVVLDGVWEFVSVTSA